MVITAASFPTPDLIKDTKDLAVLDQLARFADVQAAAANQAVAELADLIDRQHTPATQAFQQVYAQISAWRHRVTQQSAGHRAENSADPGPEEIGPGWCNIDLFGPGLRRDGGRFDPERGVIGGGAETPASRLSEQLGKAALARFDVEAPTENILDNKVKLPDGTLSYGNSLRRGDELVEALGLGRPIDGLVAAYTGEQDDRTALRQAGFETLGRLHDARATDNPPSLGDPASRRTFADAAYYLYQAPQFHRGSDAITRVLLAAAHTRIFDAVPTIPHDIDVQAYVIGQQRFHDYLNEKLTVVAPRSGSGPNLTVSQGRAAPARVRHHPRQSHHER